MKKLPASLRRLASSEERSQIFIFFGEGKSNRHRIEAKWGNWEIRLNWLEGGECHGLFTVHASSLVLPVFRPSRSGELRTQKLKSHLVRTQSLNVLPFKPGVGQYIAIHATLTAREFFLAYFYPSSPFTCSFSKTSPNFLLCWPVE